MDNNEISRITAIKAAFVGMTATQGWFYFKGMAQNRIQNAIQAALDEDDPIRAESKRLFAKAMQAAVRDLLNAVEVTQAFDPATASDDSGLGELETETEHDRIDN